MSRRDMKLKEDMPLSAAKIEDDTLASGCSVTNVFYLPLSSSTSFYLLLSKRQAKLAKVK